MTSFWDDEANLDTYEEMAKDFDGRHLVVRLREWLPAGSSVLEIGMGPGKDLDMLAETFAATGSDQSTLFLERYRARRPEADLLHLDAATLDTARTFDGIYSNKVLNLIAPEEFVQCFSRQAELLRPGGIALHGIWYGEGEEIVHGMRAVHYTEQTVTAATADCGLDIVLMERYEEFDPGDSLVVVLKQPAG